MSCGPSWDLSANRGVADSRRGRKIEAQEKAAWPGSCRLRTRPVQDCFLRSRPGYCNALCNLTTGVWVLFCLRGCKDAMVLGGLRGDGLHLPPTLHPGLGGAGREAGAPGKGLEVREARRLHPSASMGAGSGWRRRRWKRSSLGRGLHLYCAAGKGGRLPRRGDGLGSRGEEGAAAKRARPSLRAMTVERGAGEEGRRPGPARGCSALVQKPEPGVAPLAACSSSSAGETAAPKPRAAASRGQG